MAMYRGTAWKSLSVPIAGFISKYGQLSREQMPDTLMSLAGIHNIFDASMLFAGRVSSVREASSKLSFLDLVQQGQKTQVILNASHVKDLVLPRRGDIIGTDSIAVGYISMIIADVCRSPRKSYSHRFRGTFAKGRGDANVVSVSCQLAG